MGGKSRVAKRISSVLNSYIRSETTYVEPFVGSASVVEHIDAKKKICSDVNPYLIAMWKALQRGWTPPRIVSESQYYSIKEQMAQFDPELVGFVGFCCSFGGKFFGGYARSGHRNYALNGHNALLRSLPGLMDVRFVCADYRDVFDIVFEDDLVIYCDPPYFQRTGYGNQFDSDVFWEWARRTASRHCIFVSEYQAPPDFRICETYELSLDLGIKHGRGATDKVLDHLWQYNVGCGNLAC